MRQSYVVCYDIRDEKRLRLVARKMEGYGKRIQYSVYYCYINKRSLEKMLWEFGKILEKEDDLIVIPLCEVCSKKLRSMSSKKFWDSEGESFIVL